MTRAVRAAVIGCGAIAHQHLDFLAASPRVELLAVCDLSPAAREYAASRYGAAHAVADVDALLALGPEVVHVLTPPRLHQELTIRAMEAGAHVICEKPIAPTARELDDVLEVAARTGRCVIESQNYRFNDHVLEIRRLVDAGALGEVLDVEARIALDVSSGGKFADPHLPSPVAGLAGGAIHDFLPHLAYSVLQMVPEAPLHDVHATWRNLSGNAVIGFDELDATACVGRARVALRFSAALKPEGFRLYVRGSRGSAETDLFQPYLRVEVPRARGPLSPLANQAQNGVALLTSSVTGLRAKLLQHSPYHGMGRMLDGFYRAVQGEAALPITPEQIRASVALVDAIVAEVPVA